MKTVLLDCLYVGIGGFAGALCRYGIALSSKHWWPGAFPLGTLIANVLGCFLIGLLLGSGLGESNRGAKLLFGVGFLGALTTFSTFAAETVGAANEESYGLAAGNVLLNLTIGFPALLLGIWCARKLFAA